MISGTEQKLSAEERLNKLRMRYDQAKARRDRWLPIWQEAYDYALPQRNNFNGNKIIADEQTQHLFDATAMDAVDQLASSLLAELTPPWSNWFGFKPGLELRPDEAEAIAPKLEHTTRVMQDHFDRSNFAVEVHQCFLDLVTGGTASLYFEETDPGHLTAFKFSAVPLSDIVLAEGNNGTLDHSYRLTEISYENLQQRFPSADLPNVIKRDGENDLNKTFKVLEAVVPDALVYRYTAFLVDVQGEAALLAEKNFSQNPFINFRWMKSPGEIYGRSPVMKSLPDIKTANKVVELILKNASISVTGIWQADDDGVLNPANIDLKPGTIIPKAVGSQGLTPLEMPARFDVSELVLTDLRARIRSALLVDRLGQVENRQITATEVLERSNEILRILGAAYGRLQSELLTPLIMRAYAILRRRGEIPDLSLDGRYVALDYRSPMAKSQAQQNVQNIFTWLDQSTKIAGQAASEAIDYAASVRYIGEALGVPSNLILRDLSSAMVSSENEHA